MIVLGGLLVAIMVSCTGGDPFDPLPVPETRPAPATPSTTRADFRGVALAPVAGSTSTTGPTVGPGPSLVAGRVDGPDGPVEGAVVRLERLVGDASASLDVSTGPQGSWQVPEVLGGRYRVRAWRAPDLAMIEPQIIFLAAGQSVELALGVERFQSNAIDTVVAPDPPQVGRSANVLVRVSTQVVDEDGVVRATPSPGLELTLSVGAGWEAQSSLREQTGSAGTATFTLVCQAPGPQPLTLTVPSEIDGPPLPGPSPFDPAAPPNPIPTDSTPTTVVVGSTSSFDLVVPACEAPLPPSTEPPDTTATTAS